MSDGLRWANGLDEKPERKPISVDLEVCLGCGHDRERCHDGRGCGKWIEASIGFEDTATRRLVFIVPARICPCNLPYGKMPLKSVVA